MSNTSTSRFELASLRVFPVALLLILSLEQLAALIAGQPGYLAPRQAREIPGAPYKIPILRSRSRRCVHGR